MADEASAILLFICSYQVWVKVTYDWSTALCLCLNCAYVDPVFTSQSYDISLGISTRRTDYPVFLYTYAYAYVDLVFTCLHMCLCLCFCLCASLNQALGAFKLNKKNYLQATKWQILYLVQLIQFPNIIPNVKPTEKNKLFKTAKLTHRNFNPF